MGLVNRIRSVVRKPSLLPEYVAFRRNPVRDIRGVRVGGFSDFSEYHVAARYMTDAEYAFFQDFPFGYGDFIDVGANLGVVSLVLAKRFPNRRIIACEPLPSTFAALEENIRRNAANITALQVAISDTDGTAAFAENNCRARASLANYFDSRTQPVRVRRLDGLMDELRIDRVALLKIDVEGFEPEVLRSTPLDRVAAVYFEIVPHLMASRGIAPDEPINMLRAAGFQLRQIGPFNWIAQR